MESEIFYVFDNNGLSIPASIQIDTYSLYLRTAKKGNSSIPLFKVINRLRENKSG